MATAGESTQGCPVVEEIRERRRGHRDTSRTPGLISRFYDHTHDDDGAQNRPPEIPHLSLTTTIGTWLQRGGSSTRSDRKGERQLVALATQVTDHPTPSRPPPEKYRRFEHKPRSLMPFANLLYLVSGLPRCSSADEPDPDWVETSKGPHIKKTKTRTLHGPEPLDVDDCSVDAVWSRLLHSRGRVRLVLMSRASPSSSCFTPKYQGEFVGVDELDAPVRSTIRTSPVSSSTMMAAPLASSVAGSMTCAHEIGTAARSTRSSRMTTAPRCSWLRYSGTTRLTRSSRLTTASGKPPPTISLDGFQQGRARRYDGARTRTAAVTSSAIFTASRRRAGQLTGQSRSRPHFSSVPRRWPVRACPPRRRACLRRASVRAQASTRARARRGSASLRPSVPHGVAATVSREEARPT